MVKTPGFAVVLFLAACSQRGVILELSPGTEDAASVTPEAATDAPRLGLAVVLVDPQSSLHDSDALLEDRIRQFGFTVEERSYVDAVDAAEGIAVIVLSSSLLAGQIDAKLPDQPIPIVVLESFSYERLGMTGMVQGDDFGALDGTTIDVLPGPFASGNAGSVVVHMPAAAINYGRPSTEAIVGAELPGLADAASTFGYEAGATMVGRTAPARRVGVFLRTGTSGSLTPVAWDLFGTAVRWAAE